MPDVAIVTDSIADLPPQVAEELGITVIPAIVSFGNDTYRDGLDLTPEQFYEKLKGSKVLPLTSAPPPAVFTEAYDKLAEKTDQIIVITLTARLSGIFLAALDGIGLMKKQCRVDVLDSTWAVMAQGFMAIAAARAAKAGAGIDEVLNVARRTIQQVDIRGTFDTLEYFARGGRIGKAQAFLGSLLNVNPIIGMKDGEVFPYSRERSRIKAIDHLYNYATSSGNLKGLSVEYATDRNEANNLFQRLRSRFPEVPIYLTRVSPVIGAHTGPGVIFVCEWREV